MAQIKVDSSGDIVTVFHDEELPVVYMTIDNARYEMSEKEARELGRLLTMEASIE